MINVRDQSRCVTLTLLGADAKRLREPPGRRRGPVHDPRHHGGHRRLLGLATAAEAVDALPGARVLDATDRTLQLHLGGKIEIRNKKPLKTRDDLSMAYTPGVARVCEVIHADPDKAFQYTIRRSSVAVVSDGTAVLGLGDIGPRAAIPVMEGKAMLFKEFAGVDAFPICLDTRDPDEIVEVVHAIGPGFGGVNLEDISAPRCFEIEDRLIDLLDIPVFHDDQHGTAVVVLAALLNALKLTGRWIEDLRTVIVGLGAAGVAVTRILVEAGASHVVGVDLLGALSIDRPGYLDGSMHPVVRALAEVTNPERRSGGLLEVLEGADLFIGVSGPGVLDASGLARMNPDPIVFAMANPVPEISPEEAAPYARIVATGRSDYPNQINNVLCFPGLFRGALDVLATRITEAMKTAAAEAIASIVGDNELREDYIIPSVFNRDVAPAVAAAVASQARESGVGGGRVRGRVRADGGVRGGAGEVGLGRRSRAYEAGPRPRRRGSHPSVFHADPGRPGSSSTITRPTSVSSRPNISPTFSPYPLRADTQDAPAADSSHRNRRYRAFGPMFARIIIRADPFVPDGSSCAQVRPLHIRVVAELSRVVRQGHPAGLQHVTARGDVKRIVGVLLDQQDRDPLAVDLLDRLVDPLHEHRGDAHRRLVEHQELGPGHQRSSDGEHLLLAARHRSRLLALALLEPRKQVVDTLEVLRDLGSTAKVGAEVEVLAYAHPRKAVAAFWTEGHAETDDFVGREARNVLALEADRPGAGRGEPRDRPQCRRLAGPVGSDHRHHLALLDLERDALQGFDRAVVGMNVRDLEQGHYFCVPR